MAFIIDWVGTVAISVRTSTGTQLAFSLEENQLIPPEFKEGDEVEISNHPDHPAHLAMGMENGGYYEITHVPTGTVLRIRHRADMYKV
jgi:hypothetical protein